MRFYFLVSLNLSRIFSFHVFQSKIDKYYLAVTQDEEKLDIDLLLFNKFCPCFKTTRPYK